LCKPGSRRQLDYQLNTDGPEVLNNLNRLAGTAQESRPVNRTLEYFLGGIGEAPIAGLRHRMVRRLIRMRALDAGRVPGGVVCRSPCGAAGVISCPAPAIVTIA